MKPHDLVQGTLSLLILRILALEPAHGWALAQRLKQMSKDVLQVGPGSLYPALHKLEQEGITTDELDRAKVQLKSENVMRSEGSGARMSAISRSWWFERKVRTIQEVKQAIDAVTQEQVLQVLHRFSPLNPLTIAAIGPLNQDELVGDTL